MKAVARSLGKAYPSLVRPHALHPSSVDPEHPFGTAIGGSLVPPISPSSWSYVKPVFCKIFTAYLGTSPLGAPPLPDVAGAEEPALATQITARLELRGAHPSYSDIFAAVKNAPVDTLAEVRALFLGTILPLSNLIRAMMATADHGGGAAALDPPPGSSSGSCHSWCRFWWWGPSIILPFSLHRT